MASNAAFALSPAQRAITHVVLLIMCLPFAMPVIWMLSTSLKSDAQIFPKENEASTPFTLDRLVPHPVQWRNYPEALKTVPFGTYLRNTLMLCVLNVIGAVLSSAIVAYGFARLNFPGREWLFILMISTMALPGQVTMIPVFLMFRAFGWYGTFLPLIVPAFFGNPFFIFLLRQFFLGIPRDLLDSARLAGASELQILWHLVLPLSRPALAMVGLFHFLYMWKDFMGPLIYLNDKARFTLSLALQHFHTEQGGTPWHLMMAASVVFSLPLIVLFFMTVKTFIRSITMTGLKG